MIKIMLVIFLTFFEANFCTGLSNNNLGSNVNLFHDINVHLQDTIVEVITSLKSKRDFFDQCVTRLLLSMFASLKNVSNRTYRIHTEFKNASRLNVEFHLLKNTSLFKIDNPIDEILTQNFYMKNKTTGLDPNDIKISSDFMDTSDISEDVVTLLQNYLTDVYKLRFLDLENASQTIMELYDKHKKFWHPRSRHLNVWAPPKGILGTNRRKMLQERNTKIDDFPFVASVHVKNEFVCSGSVIGNNIILTAASCVEESFVNPNFLQNNPGSIAVRVGSDYPDRSGNWIEATTIFIHPKFDLDTLRNNIAIIKTRKHLHINAKCKKIRRTNKLMKILPKSVKVVTILGWGSKDSPSYNNQSNTLSYTLLNVMHEAKECSTIYARNYAAKENFCAGFNKSDTGTCQRDIGGPAIIGTKLAGLVSFGPPTCEPSDAPTVFTNVAFYNKWINSIINNKTHKIFSVNVSSSHQPRAQNGSNNLNAISKNTMNPQHMKLDSEVLRLRENDKNFKLDLHYDDFDFEAQTDSYLWITTTTVDLLHHSLDNQSLFFIETGPPKDEIFTTHKPLEEALIDYYEDKIKDNRDAISVDIPNGVKEYRKRLSPLKKNRKDEVGKSQDLQLNKNILSFPNKKSSIHEVDIRKKAYFKQMHETLSKPRNWTPQHLKYRILKDFTTQRTMTRQQYNATQRVKALRLRHSSSRTNYYTTSATNSKSRLISSVKYLKNKPSHQSTKENNPEDYNDGKFNKYVFLLRHQLTKKSKKINHKNTLKVKHNVSQIGSNVKYYDGLKSKSKYKANFISAAHHVSDEDKIEPFMEEENLLNTSMEVKINDLTTQITHKLQNRFNKFLHNKAAKNGITKKSKKLDKPTSLEKKTHLRMGENSKVLSNKNNELQKVLVLIMDREISVIDERTHKNKIVNLQSKHSRDILRMAKSTTIGRFKTTETLKFKQLNFDKAISNLEKIIFKKQKLAQKTTKSDREFHVEQILRKLNISTTPKINSITISEDKASDYSSEYDLNSPQMFKSLSGTENYVSKSDIVSYPKNGQKIYSNNVKLHTAIAESNNANNVYSADSYEVSTIVENQSEYDEKYVSNRRSGSKFTIPNFLEYIDF